jgi:hypothetical protein
MHRLLKGLAALLFCSSPISAQMVMAPDPLGVTMNRGGSGTTWTPDALTLPSVHFMRGNWDLMVHGFVFGQYTDAQGPRGDSQFGSLNWGMFMATHELAGGRFSFRTMLSLDPWTIGERGYPLLLQNGETYNGGVPIVDRQHPHDFWKELGVSYERAMSKSVGISLYAAPAGEPALSPVAFMHRQSAMDNPFAPLGHHWQDASHISFGVLTGGLFGNKWKLEGSIFNGREPDEYRWNIDLDALDSYSGRLTVNPTQNWSATLGYGYLNEVEAPDESVHRIVGSLLHGAQIGSEGQVATTLVVGANSHHALTTTMSLLESEAVFDGRNTLFARAEVGTKTSDDFAIPLSSPIQKYAIKAVSVGYIREIIKVKRATFGLGVMGSINHVPSALEARYGSQSPKAFTAFVRLRPTLVRPGSMAGHAHH